MLVSDLLVFVVLEHGNAVLDDEEEVDAGQCCEAFPHAVKVCNEVGGFLGSVLTVVVLALRLQTGGGGGGGGLRGRSRTLDRDPVAEAAVQTLLKDFSPKDPFRRWRVKVHCRSAGSTVKWTQKQYWEGFFENVFQLL